jgi:hypothetical protein
MGHCNAFAPKAFANVPAMSWSPPPARDPIGRALWLGLLMLAATGSAAAREGCAQRPDYQRLRQSLKYTSGEKTMAGLEGYAASQGKLGRCESSDIDRRLGALEPALFAYASATRRVDAQAVFRCNDIEPATARCIDPPDDAAARPSSGSLRRLRSRPISPVLLVTTRRQTALQAVYVTSIAQALAGQPAMALPLVNGRITLPTADELPGALMLIGIYQSGGPWRYRKAVWYF